MTIFDNKYSCTNSTDRSIDDHILSKAQQYILNNFSIIPVDSDKRPVVGKGEVECMTGRTATSEELLYFSNGKTRTAGIGQDFLRIYKAK